MKFRVTLKDPDGFCECIDDAVRAAIAPLKLSKAESIALVEVRAQQVRDSLKKWVEYSEYIEIDFDTDAMTATVVERG